MSYKFCPMCGEKVTNESFKFCPECGYKFDYEDATKHNESEKKFENKRTMDDEKRKKMKECPNCNHLLNKVAKKCPYCGHNFNEIKEGEKTSFNLDKKRNENTSYTRTKSDEEISKEISRQVSHAIISGLFTDSKKERDNAKAMTKDMDRKSEVRRRNAERERQEELKKREEEKNSEKENSRTTYGAFPCHYSEKRYNTFIGVYPEFFNGVCTIYKNRLVIQGKKRQKVISFSNISSIEYNKSFLKGSEMVITLSGGNIIELTIREDAYYIINQLWNQGDY